MGRTGSENEYPREIREILRAHHAGGVTQADCIACSSPCCSRGGFAILENVIQIHDLYVRGGLVRPDFPFEPGLGFEDFVYRYFDVYTQTVVVEGRKSSVLFFHMKNVSSDGHLISIPPVGSYWDTRLSLFEANPWLNRGCVFLSHGVPDWPADDGDSERRCLLHDAASGSCLTTKPIDCVFFTCNRPREAREPTPERSHEWFVALARAYPGSVERFERWLT